MKISYQWLKVYCPDLAASPTELGERLLLAGFPVESIESVGDDVVLDVEVTSNRPDLLGYLGMAREVAALTGATFAPPKVSEIGNPLSPTLPERGRENTGAATSELAARASVQIQSPDCPYYTARIIENVKIGPSPAWLTRRLEAMGLRPINNIVDITNYVLFEFSQPLHAFDYDKLAAASGATAKTIIVRRAKPGEKMVSIDGHLRELDPSMLVIADSSKPVAVAGVMGGLDTEVGPATRTVLLESAYFDPLSVRATARKLALFSDSSFRFERGVDPAGIEAASNRAVDLMVDLAGGKPLAGFAMGMTTQSGPADWANRSATEVSLRLSRLQKLIGMAVPTERVVQILSRLFLSPNPRLSATGDFVACSIPSFRPDIRREVDLIEEVARVEGYDKIPVHDRIEIAVRPPNKRQTTIRRIARGLCGLGLFETVSITFVTANRAELFARGEAGHLAVSHSSRKAENALRRSLLPSLLQARRHNETVQVRRADLFEIASVFDPPAGGDKLPSESLRLGLVTDGDFREARGVIEQVVALVSRSAKLAFHPADRKEFVPGQGAAILLNGQSIGLIGSVSESVRAIFELRGEVAVAEIDVEPLLVLAGEVKTCTPLARFPAIERDLSILVDELVTWQQVEQAIRGSAVAELEAIEFADLFRGGAAKQFPAGKKSFTFTLRYRSADGTLTNEQANEFADQTVKALTGQLGAVLRDK